MSTDWLREYIERMDSDLKEIKSDVKKLTKFKWKVAGGVTVVCIITTALVQVISIWFRI